MERDFRHLADDNHRIIGLGRVQRFLTRFFHAKKGTTAVEFGLLALPFVGLVTACLENALVYWQQEILQQAVTEAGRQFTRENSRRRTRDSDGRR